MIAICLLTALAGLISGSAIAHHLGYETSFLLVPGASAWDWQSLVLASVGAIGGLEGAVRVFDEDEAQPSQD